MTGGDTLIEAAYVFRWIYWGHEEGCSGGNKIALNIGLYITKNRLLETKMNQLALSDYEL